MTEREKILYAKTVIDNLANGIHPLTGEEIPESEVIHQVKISRCLFYVSDLLRQASENGGSFEKRKTTSKQPFQLDQEMRKGFRLSQTPIPVSEITKRINELVTSEEMTKLTHRNITDWLVECGLLKWVTESNGKRARWPTPDGSKLGIEVEQRCGSNGTYAVIVYQPSAQQYIIDHLDAIVEGSCPSKQAMQLQGQPWSQLHDETLTDLFYKGVSISEIAITLKRSETGVRARLKSLGLIQHRHDI